MAQSVERRIGSAEVTGPIPVSSSHEVEDLCRQRFSAFLFLKKGSYADFYKIFLHKSLFLFPIPESHPS